MKRKKLFSFLFLLLISINLVSCKTLSSNNNVDSNIGEKVPEDTTSPKDIEDTSKENVSSFEAFGKTYISTKDLSLVEYGTNIYDDQQSLHYTAGEYKEIDFINDLLYSYLNEDNSVYDYLISYDSTSEKGYITITEKDMEKLKKDLESLRSQMELSSGQEMVVRLDRVTYEGIDSKINSGHSFKIRVAISRVGATIVPWNFFTVSVFEDGNKLVAYLF